MSTEIHRNLMFRVFVGCKIIAFCECTSACVRACIDMQQNCQNNQISFVRMRPLLFQANLDHTRIIKYHTLKYVRIIFKKIKYAYDASTDILYMRIRFHTLKYVRMIPKI
jgi:hypothetical protein